MSQVTGTGSCTASARTSLPVLLQTAAPPTTPLLVNVTCVVMSDPANGITIRSSDPAQDPYTLALRAP